jgi:hypothetical protein
MIAEDVLMTTIGGSVKDHDGLMQAYRVSTERVRQQKREKIRQALIAERSRKESAAVPSNDSDSESESESEDEAGPEQDSDDELQDEVQEFREQEQEEVVIFRCESGEDESDDGMTDESGDEDEDWDNGQREDEDEEEKEAENQQFHAVKLFSSPSAKQNAPLEVPLAGTVGRCTVKRIRASKLKRIQTQYRRYELRCEGSDVLLMTAVKQINGSIEIFDETRGRNGAKLNKKNGNYLGKLKGNRGRSMFNVIGKKKGESLACVHCRKSTKRGVLASAHLNVMLPPIGSRGKRDSAAAPVVLTNKPPQKVQSAKSGYRLNFGGRVKVASVKNFQIIADHSPEDVLMQFGKVSKDEFICDYQTPFTPVQAFAVCLIQMR